MESKKAKDLERERQRIVQNKASWWKEFDWVVGVMVEMEWDGEFRERTSVRAFPCIIEDMLRMASIGINCFARVVNDFIFPHSFLLRVSSIAF